MAQGFSPHLGVVPCLFFNAVHRSTLPLASPASPHWFFKVGIVSLQIGLQIGQVYNWSTLHCLASPLGDTPLTGPHCV
jgi:hypothetical protein